MNTKKVLNKSKKKYILSIAFISLITLVSSKFTTLTDTFFDKAIAIEYIGQVEGFPVEDAVTYNYTSTGNYNGRINCTMSRSEFNPYNLEENYAVTKTDKKIEIDLKSVIHPMNLTADDNTQITSSGDKIDLPNNLTVGERLADKSGTLTFAINDRATKKMDIKVKDRIVVAKEEIIVDQLKYETYRLDYTIITQKYYNGVLFEKTAEDIQEWVLPGVGFLKRISSTEGSYYNNNEVMNTYNTKFTLTAKSIK
jgi:hypothetical protein